VAADILAAEKGRKIQCVVCEHAKILAAPRKPERSAVSVI